MSGRGGGIHWSPRASPRPARSLISADPPSSPPRSISSAPKRPPPASYSVSGKPIETRRRICGLAACNRLVTVEEDAVSPFTPPLSRRRLLMASTAAVLVPRWGAAAEMATPVQEEGPFYPRSFPLDVDNDLVRVSGRVGQADGDIPHPFLPVLDT